MACGRLWAVVIVLPLAAGSLCARGGWDDPPGGWDYVPEGRKVPCGESSMWGDYHMRELALYVQRIAERKPYLTFFSLTPAEQLP